MIDLLYNILYIMIGAVILIDGALNDSFRDIFLGLIIGSLVLAHILLN